MKTAKVVKVEIVERAERVSKTAAAKAAKEKELKTTLVSRKTCVAKHGWKIADCFRLQKSGALELIHVGNRSYYDEKVVIALTKEVLANHGSNHSGVMPVEEAENAYREFLRQENPKAKKVALVSRHNVIESGLEQVDYNRMERNKVITPIKIGRNIFYSKSQFEKALPSALEMVAKRVAKRKQAASKKAEKTEQSA